MGDFILIHCEALTTKSPGFHSLLRASIHSDAGIPPGVCSYLTGSASPLRPLLTVHGSLLNTGYVKIVLNSHLYIKTFYKRKCNIQRLVLTVRK